MPRSADRRRAAVGRAHGWRPAAARVRTSRIHGGHGAEANTRAYARAQAIESQKQALRAYTRREMLLDIFDCRLPDPARRAAAADRRAEPEPAPWKMNPPAHAAHTLHDPEDYRASNQAPARPYSSASCC
jgi:hypothetical protein